MAWFHSRSMTMQDIFLSLPFSYSNAQRSICQHNQTKKTTVKKTVKKKKEFLKKTPKTKLNKNKPIEQEKVPASINQVTKQEPDTSLKDNLQNENDINTILKENNVQTETKTIIHSPLNNIDNMKPYIRISPEIKEKSYTINDL